MTISSPPPRTGSQFVIQPSRYLVRLGDEQGNAPHAEQEVDHLDLLSISRSAGGSRIDALKLRYNLAQEELNLQDTGAPKGYHRQVEVCRINEDEEPGDIIGWGFLSSVDFAINRTQSLDWTIRVDPFVFGQPLRKVPFYDPDAEEVVELDRPLVFNPEIDDKIEDNRSDERDADADNAYLFLDPESRRTPQARELQSQNAARWTVPTAIHRACWLLNPDETHITNPTLEELTDIFAAVDATEFVNLTIETGSYLPAALDAILKPIGFGWYLKHARAEPSAPEEEGGEEEEEETPPPDPDRETRIQFYERGQGDEVDLFIQRINSGAIHKEKTDIENLSFSIDIASLANEVTVLGGYKRFEVTVPLIPGWPSSDDSIASADLEFNEQTMRDKPHVARKFVLNEAGDYNAPFRTGVTEFYDLRELLNGVPPSEAESEEPEEGEEPEDPPTPDKVLIRRRKFEKCLTQTNGGKEEDESLGYWLEFWDRDATDAEVPFEQDDPGWTRIKSGFSVLEKECGVLFHKPNQKLFGLSLEDLESPPAGIDHPGLHLRMTACIDSDTRLSATADRREDSPNGETINLTLGLADKFHFRQVHEDSRFADSDRPKDELDDTEKITDYAERVREIEDAAEVSCSITVPGVDQPELEIGKLIRKIDGRNIDLQSRAGGTPRKLQIVGLNQQWQPAPKTELLLETFAAERPVL